VLAGAGSKTIRANLHPRSTAANHVPGAHARSICYETAPLALSNFC
jgi:hypothetical protein